MSRKRKAAEQVATTSADLVAERREQLAALFPEALSKGKVDLEKLRAALGKDDVFVCRDVALTDELAANLALQCRLKTL